MDEANRGPHVWPGDNEYNASGACQQGEYDMQAEDAIRGRATMSMAHQGPGNKESVAERRLGEDECNALGAWQQGECGGMESG